MSEIHDFISCVKKIPVPPHIVISPVQIPSILKYVAKRDVSTNELTDLILKTEVVKEISPDEQQASLTMPLIPLDKYARFLARALILCKKYAERYKVCRELEEKNAPPDDIETCYEVADKTRAPLFIALF